MKSFRQYITEAAKEPWQMTHKEYMGYHKTGHIPSHAYEKYRTSEGLSFVTRDRYDEPMGTVDVHGQKVEIRGEREHHQYCKYKDENDQFSDFLRDKSGNLVYMSDDEMKAKGRPTQSIHLGAFVGDRPVGCASNEFGSSGVWVVDEFQKGGLGTKLLQKLHQLNPHLASKPIGQMTNAGHNMTTAYHRQHVKQALADGKPVPATVLADYPELKKQ